MIKRICLPAILILFPSLLVAQTYTEICTDGWGKGVANTRPSLADLDNNGLLDLIVGKADGTLSRYEQDTEGSTSFTLATETFDNINTGSYSSPFFTDLDSDGLLDLMIGGSGGTIHHYRQDAAGSTTFTLVTNTFSDIDVGSYSAPCFTDLDSDGLLDLITGDWQGNLFHYRQEEAGSASFTLVTETFNDIDVGDYASPFFIDLDSDGLLDMLVGAYEGNLLHYEQDAAGSSGFTLVSETFSDIDAGYRSVPCISDLNGDGMLDLLVGEISGIICYYKQDAVGGLTFSEVSVDFVPRESMDVGQNSKPCFADLDNDGLLDMIVGTYDGNLTHYEQDADGSSGFTLISENFNNIDGGAMSAPCFTDLDSDGLLDLFIGNWNGYISHYEQESTGSEMFLLVSAQFNDTYIQYQTEPCFIDLDEDGLLDLIIGTHQGNLVHYEQDEAGSSSFTLVSENFNNIDVGSYAIPVFTDLEDDGILDMVVGAKHSPIHHYKQDAARSTSFSEVIGTFSELGIGYNAAPVFVDINGDGSDDLIAGEKHGGIHYFQREGGTGVEQDNVCPVSCRLFPNYPNPFNPSTTIRYDLTRSGNVDISILNARGQIVMVIENGFRHEGTHTARWNGEDQTGRLVHSGLYFCRMRAGNYTQMIKLMLIK
jgi:uncharacterized protein (DUF2141 family)